MIHRDLKPENIAVGEFGEVIVLDWGLAKLFDQPDQPDNNPLPEQADANQTIQGRVMGTPNYMPPEQARGDVNTIDARADIYSLGAILFHIVAGCPPRHPDPEDIQVLLDQVIAGDLPRMRDLDRRAPLELAAISRAAMQHDPGQRYQTVTELADDLRHYLADAPVSVCPESIFKKTARWARDHKTFA